MALNLTTPSRDADLKPRIVVVGVGGAGCNAVNNMIAMKLEGVEFVVTNTDAQSLSLSRAERRIQLGTNMTHGLGAGARPDVGRAAAEEAMDSVIDELRGCHMAFITAGMGGGTGTGAAPVIARAARENQILTVGVVTKPFSFEGMQRMRTAEKGLEELQEVVDTLLVIPNQNLFSICNPQTTLADAFRMADDVLYSGVRGVTDLMVMPGLINLDFADIRTVMSEMGKAMMGTGEASEENRAIVAAEAAIANPLLDDVPIRGAKGVLINITGGPDLTLFEVDAAANRIRQEVDDQAQIIFGSTFDESLEGLMRVSIVATGIDANEVRTPNISLVHSADDDNSAVAGAEEASAGKPAPVHRPAGVHATAAATARAPFIDAIRTPAAQSAATQPVTAQPGVAQHPADEPFIAARPVEPEEFEHGATPNALAREMEAQSQPKAEPQREPERLPRARPGQRLSADRPGAPAAPGRRAGGLFSHWADVARTGLGGGDRRAAQEANAQAAARDEAPGGGPVAEARAAPTQDGQSQHTRFLDKGERPGRRPTEEDLLKIPAFLREQAN